MPATPQEDRELEAVAERLAQVHTACVCMLHDVWMSDKERSILYFSNRTFKQFASRLELLLRDSVRFQQVMAEIRE